MKKFHHHVFIVSALCLACLSVFPVAASQQETTFVLDSAYTYDGNKVLKTKVYYTYDMWGNRTKTETYVWNKNQFAGTFKNLYTYNASGIQLSWELHQWNYVTNTWKPSGRQESVYDGNNRTQSLEMKWDELSNAWVAQAKSLMQYDTNGNLTSHERYSWNSTTQLWVGSYKFTNTYDEKGFPVSSKTYHWDELTGIWVDDATSLSNYNYDYTYDNSHNLTKVVLKVLETNTQVWSDSMKWEYTINNQNKTIKTETFTITPIKTWKLTARDLFDFDGSGNRTLEEMYYYDASVDSLIGNQKHTWTYDENGHITQSINYYWDYTGTWVPGSKNVSAYTDDGKTTLSEDYIWDAAQSIWIGQGKNEYTYNQQGSITTSLMYMWDYASNGWRVSYKTQSTFENGRITSLENQSWDYTKNSLINSGKETYSYNSDGKLQTKEQFTWNDSNSSWVPNQKIDNTYDEHGYQLVNETFFWNNTQHVYNSYERNEYYYSALVTGINNIHHTVTAFDVRTADGTIIINFAPTSQLSTVRIFDANGRLVNVVSGLNGTVQHVKTAKSGIYMVTDGFTTVKIKHK